MIRASGPCFLVILNHGSDELKERFAAGEPRGATQIFFDAQKLIVFSDAIRARQRSGFYLARVSRDGQIGDEGILCFAGAMRDDRGATVSLRELDAVQR